MTRISAALLFLAICSPPLVGYADGPGDNDPLKVRRVPRLGLKVDEAETSPLMNRAFAIELSIAELEKRDKRSGNIVAR